MEVIHLIQQSVPWLGDFTSAWSFHGSWGSWSELSTIFPVSVDWSLAQFDTDVFRPAREFLDNFVQSGQLWALLIGIVLGYILRSFTTYG